MPKFFKKVTAERCPIHQAILDECAKRLADVGYFNKQAVLDSLNFQTVSEIIRWDYLADFLSDKDGRYGVELVPLAQKFFSSTRTERMRDAKEYDGKGKPMNLGPYIAGGHSKKTAGYASITFEGGSLAVKRAQRFASQRNGVGKALDNYIDAVKRKQEQMSQDNVLQIESLKNSA